MGISGFRPVLHRHNVATLYSAMPACRPTARETEIKLRVADLAALIRHLRRLGARCHGRVLERNILYDTPDSDFRGRGRLLRVRFEAPVPSKLVPGGPPCVRITSKSPAPDSTRSRYKVKLERELIVRSMPGLPANLRTLGLRPAFIYEKFRTTLRLRGLHLDLDETPVGIFFEIEGPPKAIDRIARALGFSPSDYIRATYWGLYAADCRRRGKIPRNMLFSREKFAKRALFA
jgi:adenylate cyclase, class 2